MMADAAPVSGQEGGGGMNMLLVMALMLAAMYFLMIRPQQTRQKKHQAMLKSLESGDKIVTIGGLYGTITNVKDKTYIVKIADNTKIEILKAAVQDKLAVKSEEESKSEEGGK